MSVVQLFLRWMFVLIIALDLISSPWHEHRHENAPESVASHFDQANYSIADVDHLVDHDSSLTHVDSEKSLKIGHSLTALRGASVQIAATDSITEWKLLPTTSALLGLVSVSRVEIPSSWATERKRPRLPSFRALPPDGRAPPFLLA